MTKYRPGDIVAVEFPFSELQTRKRRPGLVLVSGDDDVVVARLTTHPPRAASDVALSRWAESGLPRASTVRLTKLATIDQRLVSHVIGRLRPEDGLAVGQAFERLVSSLLSELKQ